MAVSVAVIPFAGVAKQMAPKRTVGTRLGGLWLVGVASLIYASEAIYIRKLHLPVLAIAGIRLCLAALGGFLVSRFRRDSWPDLAEMPWRRLVVLGVLAATNSVCFIAAIQSTDVGIVLVIAFTWPLWVTLAYGLFRVHKTSRQILLSMVAAVFGLFLLVIRPGAAAGVWGIGLAVGVSMTMAAMVLIERATDVRHAATLLFVFKSLIAALLLLPVGLSLLVGTGLSPSDAGWLLLLGVIVSGVGGSLFLIGMRVLSTAEAGAMSYIEPVVATGLAAWLLGERPDWRSAVGIAIVLGASLYMLRSQDSDAHAGYRNEGNVEVISVSSDVV